MNVSVKIRIAIDIIAHSLRREGPLLWNPCFRKLLFLFLNYENMITHLQETWKTQNKSHIVRRLFVQDHLCALGLAVIAAQFNTWSKTSALVMDVQGPGKPLSTAGPVSAGHWVLTLWRSMTVSLHLWKWTLFHKRDTWEKNGNDFLALICPNWLKLLR